MTEPDWIAPDWPAPAWVRSVFTTQAGGFSTGLFASMNLGDHVGDVPAAVALNRARLQQSLQARAVFLKQVHGHQVLELQPGMPDAGVADASVSAHAGLACTVLVADCLPVLLAHQHRPVVAAAHAGWRGLAGAAGAAARVAGTGVLEATFEKFCQLAGQLPPAAAPQTLAWLGPCIGPSAFEVGPEVRAAFVQHHAGATSLFKPGACGKYWADLPGLARLRLGALGISQIYGNDSGSNWCTVMNPSRFFSHRRTSALAGAVAGGTGGRMGACVWLV